MKNNNRQGSIALASALCLGLGAASMASAAWAQTAVEAGVVGRQSAQAATAAPARRIAVQNRMQPKRGSAAGVPGSVAAQPTVRQIDGPKCSGEAASPGRLVLPVGKSTLVRLPEPIVNRTIGNPGIVQAMLVSPQTLYLLGVDIGTTNMIIQGKSGACTAIDVVVGMDPGGLQATLGELMPEEKNIKVTAAADTLVMSGTVADAAAVNRAIELANAFVRRPATSVHSGMPTEDGRPAAAAAPGAQGQQRAGGQTRVVNLLNVSAPQQVMLEVKIAEVSKSLLDKLGANVALNKTSGTWTYTLLSNFLTGTANGLFDATKSNGNQFSLEAEKRDGLVKILAEPTVLAISGQEGSFLAGGKIFIPVAQSGDAGFLRVTLEEKEFGVGLRFTPTVLSGGRINLKVAPEVSELSREGVGISAVGTSGTAILPLITTRRATTTIQLFDGQSFAIGGLIKNNVVANIRAYPVLGEVPVLGALFRSNDFQQDKTELLFVVTPRLVKPLPQTASLPTDAIPDPSRPEFFLGGRMEGSAPPSAPVSTAPAASPASPAIVPASGGAAGQGGFEVK